jgi:hypothetical protein
MKKKNGIVFLQTRINEAVLYASFKSLPKGCRIATLDPETYGILQRNLTTPMPAQVLAKSLNTSHLLVHEIGELLLRRCAPFSVIVYACLACHDLIFLQCFWKFYYD